MTIRTQAEHHLPPFGKRPVILREQTDIAVGARGQTAVCRLVIVQPLG
jgi:hypothetical protein